MGRSTVQEAPILMPDSDGSSSPTAMRRHGRRSHRKPVQSEPLRGHVTYFVVSLRNGHHEGFEQKSPLYVLELYPYTLQPRPERWRGTAPWPLHAIGNVSVAGGSSIEQRPSVL